MSSITHNLFMWKQQKKKFFSKHVNYLGAMTSKNEKLEHLLPSWNTDLSRW